MLCSPSLAWRLRLLTMLVVSVCDILEVGEIRILYQVYCSDSFSVRRRFHCVRSFRDVASECVCKYARDLIECFHYYFRVRECDCMCICAVGMAATAVIPTSRCSIARILCPRTSVSSSSRLWISFECFSFQANAVQRSRMHDFLVLLFSSLP